jgi:transglutaminase-like putative cysteine protease
LSLAVRWQIQHATRYTYAAPVRDSFNEVRLMPFSNEHQTVEAFQISVTPSTKVSLYHDFYSNAVHHFEIAEPHGELAVQANMSIATHAKPTLAEEARPIAMSRVKEALQGERTYDFILESRFVDISPTTWHLAVDAIQGEEDMWQCALRLMRFVHGHVQYQPHSTSVHTHMRQVLAQRTGVCQDFAHVMLGLCRTLKIPALYVSGYLATETASATHAWVEVYIPGAGWQALDPTHNCIPGDTYVKIGVGRDYADVPPVSGTYKGTTERTMDVSVQIQRME